MRTSEQVNEISAALAKAQARIEGAIKDKTNPAFRQKYADLGAVWDAIRAPMTDNGLSVTQELGNADGRVSCSTTLWHASGQWMAFDPFGLPVGKQDAQGFGSAATYVRRYSLMAAAGIAPIDDDGQAATVKREEVRQEAPAALLASAAAAASCGIETFQEFWKGISSAERTAIGSVEKERLKAVAGAAQ